MRKKTLVISLKSNKKFFSDIKKSMKALQSGKSPKATHFEISFEDPKDLNKFIKNLPILMVILNQSPKTIYELAKILGRDVSNIRKIVNFFEEMGAIKIEEKKVSGKTVKKPTVFYDKIEFQLKAA